MTAEIISVGAEILMGNIVNTNASYLAGKCAALGLCCYYQSVVGDNHDRLSDTVQTALSRADVILLSGGLGPTEDDLTKEAVAEVMGDRLVEDSHSRARIQAYMENYVKSHPHLAVTDNNWKQALIPEGAMVLDNENGTAPGLIIEKNGKTVVLLPGPPLEMIPMFEEQVYPYLARRQKELLYSDMVKICGVGESVAETRILDLIDAQTNPTLATYAKTGEVHIRITAKASSKEDAKELIAPVEKELYDRFGTHIFTNREEETLEGALVQLLCEKGLTLTTAESCTGGAVASRIVNVPGASKVLMQGLVTYSNEAKKKYLGVSEDTLESFGAVSEETAEEMAVGACRMTGTSASVVTTGIAGPGGGTPEKPVGLVYIGCCVNGCVKVQKYLFNGNREKIRAQASVNALTLLWDTVWEICGEGMTH